MLGDVSRLELSHLTPSFFKQRAATETIETAEADTIQSLQLDFVPERVLVVVDYAFV